MLTYWRGHGGCGCVYGGVSNQSPLNLKCTSILTIVVNSFKRSKPVGCTVATLGHFMLLSNLN